MSDVNAAEALRLLGTDAVLVDAAPELLRARGADRVTFLHRLLTANVAAVPVGGGCEALLLTTKGHVAAAMSILLAEDEVRLVTPAGEGEGTAAALGRYAVMDDFAVALDRAVVARALVGPRTAARLVAAGVPLPPDLATRPLLAHLSLPETPFGSLLVVRTRSHGADGLIVWAPADGSAALDAALAAPGLRRLTGEAAEAARIVAGEPRWGAEITPDVFPMEVGLSTAIDYGKGCFLGQEPIVRIRDRGHINWRLVGLRLGGDEPPARGDRLEATTKEKAGRVTSAARGPDGPVALALLHVSVPVGSELRVHHGESVLSAQVVEA